MVGFVVTNPDDSLHVLSRKAEQFVSDFRSIFWGSWNSAHQKQFSPVKCQQRQVISTTVGMNA